MNELNSLYQLILSECCIYCVYYVSVCWKIEILQRQKIYEVLYNNHTRKLYVLLEYCMKYQ